MSITELDTLFEFKPGAKWTGKSPTRISLSVGLLFAGSDLPDPSCSNRAHNIFFFYWSGHFRPTGLTCSYILLIVELTQVSLTEHSIQIWLDQFNSPNSLIYWVKVTQTDSSMLEWDFSPSRSLGKRLQISTIRTTGLTGSYNSSSLNWAAFFCRMKQTTEKTGMIACSQRKK